MVTTTTSVIGGNWSVAGIPQGSVCTVSVDETDLPSTAYAQTGDPGEVGTCVICDAQHQVTVNADVNGVNFGYQEQLGSISGEVCDGTGDGFCDDPGDAPLVAWSIDVVLCANPVGSVHGDQHHHHQCLRRLHVRGP